MRIRTCGVVVGLVGLLALCSPAMADQTLVDFETGPPLDTTPVTDQYKATDFVQFLADDQGFRPYREAVSASEANSGAVVADVGPDVCTKEGFNGADCEFFGGGIFTYGRFTRTATGVTLYAGFFSDPGRTIQARLLGYDSSSSTVPVATGPWVTVAYPGFKTPVSVAHPGGMTAFALEISDVGAIGFDDLTMTFPTGSLPDVSMSTTAQVVPVLDGRSTDVPITITRLNGSSGDLRFSVTGLPAGVTGEVIPNPLTGTDESATLRLTAAPDAPEVVQPATATITADPQGNAGVAQGPRSASVLVRVASPYGLQGPTGGAAAALPDCTPVDVPVTVARDRSFDGTITLSVENLPPGISAQILPSPVIPPGGNVNASVTVRLSRGAGALVTGPALLRATSPGLADRTLGIALSRAAPLATPRSNLAFTPRHMGPGTTITLDGNGFCPGTTVQVGTPKATAPTSVAADGRSLTFTTPRGALSGPVRVVPPDNGFIYPTTSSLTVHGFRDTAGFAFHNPSFGHVSIDELTDAFGADDLFIKVNPCWPWGSCTVVTGILNPIAAIAWGAIDIAAHESGGHCFGITRGVERLLNHRVPYARFAAVSSAFELPSPSGPSDDLESWLDGQHATQFSAEFADAWIDGKYAPIGDQLQVLTDELSAGRDPIVTLTDGSFGNGHAVIAYDAQQVADGTDVYVYDSNREYTSGEATDADKHADVELQQSVIHFHTGGAIVTDDNWSFVMASGKTWSGINDSALSSDGHLFVAPQSTIPDDPSLPGLGTLAHLVGFGSADGSVRATGGPGGSDFLPALDANGLPGAAGTFVGKGAGPVTAHFKGASTGSYSAAYTAPGFAAAVEGVRSRQGVGDALTGHGDGVTFHSGMSRPLSLALASGPRGGANGTAWAATIATHGSQRGSESAGLTRRGVLSYQHTGAPTTMRFALSRLRTDGGATRFVSGPVRVRRGDLVVVRAADAGLRRVRVRVHGRTRLMRNRAAAIARVRVRSLTVRGRRVRAVVRIARLRGTAALGVVLRARRGKRVVARHVAAGPRVRNGSRTVTWTLPAKTRGKLSLTADVRLTSTGGAGSPVTGSATAHRRRAISVR